MLAAYTFVHVVLSLVGIGSGFVVLFGLIGGKRLDGWTKLFLVTTVATSATGFGFPVHSLMPSHVIGILSLIVLAVAIIARYTRGLAGGWTKAYVICSAFALYFNVFVLVVQAFRRVSFLNELAPTQSEPPFAIVQVAVMALFVVLTTLAVKRFHLAVTPTGAQPFAKSARSGI